MIVIALEEELDTNPNIVQAITLSDYAILSSKKTFRIIKNRETGLITPPNLSIENKHLKKILKKMQNNTLVMV